ncbi:hypothetical protein FQZ97_1079900 [compost metagenome]
MDQGSSNGRVYTTAQCHNHFAVTQLGFQAGNCFFNISSRGPGLAAFTYINHKVFDHFAAFSTVCHFRVELDTIYRLCIFIYAVSRYRNTVCFCQQGKAFWQFFNTIAMAHPNLGTFTDITQETFLVFHNQVRSSVLTTV